MISRNVLRRSCTRIAAVLVAAACLDGCAAQSAWEPERSAAQEVVVKKGGSQKTMNPNTTITNTADGTTDVWIRVYAVRCAGLDGAKGRDCVAANKKNVELWKKDAKPFKDSTKREYDDREDWAEKVAFFGEYTYRLDKGASMSIADVIKEHVLDDPDTGAFFLFAIVKVKSGSCEVEKIETEATTLEPACGDGEVSITFGPPPAEPPTTETSTTLEPITTIKPAF